MKKRIWFITQKQISDGDIDSAIIAVDPEQLSEEQVYGLHGNVRLRIENATGPASIFGNPASRNYFRELHKRWPWAGYFLRLRPIKPNSSTRTVVDLSLFMSLAFCHCDDLVYCETKHGVGLRYDLSQLSKHLAELQGRAAEPWTSIWDWRSPWLGKNGRDWQNRCDHEPRQRGWLVSRVVHHSAASLVFCPTTPLDAA